MMKKTLWAAALLAAVLALPGAARAHGYGRVEAGASVHLQFLPNAAGQQLGPWYLYWPLEAHFQPVAPIAYPYYPQTMALPPTFGTAPGGGLPGGYPAYGPPAHGAPGHAAPAPAPAPSTPMKSASFQPVGYFPQQVPSYWYGR